MDEEEQSFESQSEDQDQDEDVDMNGVNGDAASETGPVVSIQESLEQSAFKLRSNNQGLLKFSMCVFVSTDIS